jgi:predicted Ser/Thr protein kinase
MPDRDWVKYKAIRGQSLPEMGEWLGHPWQLAQVLKFDFYAATGVYERADRNESAPGLPRQLLVKVYHQDAFGMIPLGWLGRWLCRRETAQLNALEGVEGIPQLLAQHGRSGLVREFICGCNLREHGKTAGLRDDFFPRLRAILTRVHERGMSHNDLSKPENVLVSASGLPVLIDFQIALGGPNGNRLTRWLLRPLIQYLQGVDRYHLGKIHRRFRPFDFTAAELEEARRKGLIVHLHGYVRRPYRKVRHFVLDRYLKHENASAE